MKKIFLIVLFCTLFACKSDEGTLPVFVGQLEPKSTGELIKHTYYSLAYSEENEQAYWVYYVLTPDEINGVQSRTDDFRADPSVSTGSASLDDYKNSGYDRGHLCPAADMTQNKTAMSETFFLSNMSPQVQGFNRGIWSKLEDQVRKWAIEFDTLNVATGPIFKDNLGAIGQNKVTVPGYFYKAIYAKENHIMIGLILPNKSSSEPLEHFVVSVDSIEALTGIDMFPGLEDNLENQLEKKVSTGVWF